MFMFIYSYGLHMKATSSVFICSCNQFIMVTCLRMGQTCIGIQLQKINCNVLQMCFTMCFKLQYNLYSAYEL